MSDAKKEGRQAYLSGDHVNDNPYPNSTQEHFEWHIGFCSAGFYAKTR